MARFNKHVNKAEDAEKAVGFAKVIAFIVKYWVVLLALLCLLIAFVVYLIVSANATLNQLVASYTSLTARVSDSHAGFDKRLFYITTDAQGNMVINVGYRSEEQQAMAEQAYEEATGNSVINVNISTDGWYTDITSGSATSSRQLIADGYYLYDGPPWDITSGTYIYNYPQAKYDTYSMITNLGVEGNPITDSNMYRAYALSSSATNMCTNHGFSQSGSTYIKVIDGVPCLPFCPMPTLVDRNYISSGMWGTNSTADLSLYNYVNGRIALIVVENVSDISDSSKWLYIPLSPVDAKAHTYPWGVVQTNIKVINNSRLQFSRDWNGNSENSQHNKDYPNVSSDDAIRDAIVNVVMNDEMRKTESFTIWSWYNHGVELYNTNSTIVNKINSYYAVGFMVWR